MGKKIYNFIRYLKKPALVLLLAGVSWLVYALPGNFIQDTGQVKVIKCYPNPATSFINFEFRKDIDQTYILRIYSFVGKQMIETPVSGNKVTFTLDNFYRGIYFFKLHDKAGKILESGKFQVVK